LNGAPLCFKVIFGTQKFIFNVFWGSHIFCWHINSVYVDYNGFSGNKKHLLRDVFWWNYITLLEHFLNGTDRLRFAPAERSGAAEFPPHPPFRRALTGGQNFFAANLVYFTTKKQKSPAGLLKTTCASVTEYATYLH